MVFFRLFFRAVIQDRVCLGVVLTGRGGGGNKRPPISITSTRTHTHAYMAYTIHRLRPYDPKKERKKKTRVDQDTEGLDVAGRRGCRSGSKRLTASRT